MLISEKLKNMQTKDVFDLYEKTKRFEFAQDEDVLAMYNSERAERYGNVAVIDFLDFGQSHAFKTLVESEMLDRAFG